MSGVRPAPSDTPRQLLQFICYHADPVMRIEGARVLHRAAGEPAPGRPIAYRARSNEEGKKLTARDGLRVIRTLVRCRLSPKVAPATGPP